MPRCQIILLLKLFRIALYPIDSELDVACPDLVSGNGYSRPRQVLFLPGISCMRYSAPQNFVHIFLTDHLGLVVSLADYFLDVSHVGA